MPHSYSVPSQAKSLPLAISGRLFSSLPLSEAIYLIGRAWGAAAFCERLIAMSPVDEGTPLLREVVDRRPRLSHNRYCAMFMPAPGYFRLSTEDSFLDAVNVVWSILCDRGRSWVLCGTKADSDKSRNPIALLCLLS